MKISLCVITGQEALHVERFLNSFAEAFDELCLVRAVGDQEPDETMDLARAWCLEHGKAFLFAEYTNQGPRFVLEEGRPAVLDNRPETWRHVDDFAAARNLAWDLATTPWQFWADLDDVLREGDAPKIRAWADQGNADIYLFRYAIRTSGEEVMRERLFRRGICRWELPVHERCGDYRPHPEGKDWRLHADHGVVFMHQPDTAKPRVARRNIRIMEHALRMQNEFPMSLLVEWYYEWCHARFDLKNKDQEETARCAEKVRYWGAVANEVHTIPERRIQLYLIQAHLHADQDITRSVDLCWEAIRLAPHRKEGWGCLAEYSLAAGQFQRADIASELMSAFKIFPAGTIPKSQKYSGWEGLLLRTRCLRANGQEEKARKLEVEIFRKNGARISLLHATRGRPDQALETKSNFFKSAVMPLGVEHIFAIDADDHESLEKLQHHRHVVIREPRGCVRAWNTAALASDGAVLIQLSDDWLPCIHWDEYIYGRLEAAAKARGASFPIAEVPMVLAISDNHRTDSLLCMAICTRARYLEQREHGGRWDKPLPAFAEDTILRQELLNRQAPYLFFPGYVGVYSDTEFTVRAYDDGVVVQGQDIVFDHRHPLFQGVPLEAMDATYRAQNSPERYAEGKALFNSRNPKHAQP